MLHLYLASKIQNLILVSYKINKNNKKTSNTKIINFGVTPYESEEVLKAIYNPILEYLSKKTGDKYVFNIATDYKTLISDVKNGNISIANFSPASYVDALKAIPDIKYIATIGNKNPDNNDIEYFYQSYIFTKNDSKIESIQDLKGVDFGFVDEKSSSGYK